MPALTIYLLSTTPSSNRWTSAIKFDLPRNLNARSPMLVTMPHACSLAMTTDFLSSSALAPFIPPSRRLTTQSF